MVPINCTTSKILWLLQWYSTVVQQGSIFYRGDRRGTDQLYRTQNPMGVVTVVQYHGTLGWYFYHGNRRGTNQLYQTKNTMGLLQWYSNGVQQGCMGVFLPW